MQNDIQIIELKGNLTEIENQILATINNYESYKNQNLIFDGSENQNLTLTSLKLFQEISKTHKKSKKSLVIVAQDIDFNKVSSKLNVVPTIQEAMDLIEMEEMIRELK